MICSLLQCFPCTPYIHGHFFFSYSLLFCPEDGSSRFLWNTGKYVPASHPKRQSFSEELFLKKRLRAQNLYSQITPECSKKQTLCRLETSEYYPCETSLIILLLQSTEVGKHLLPCSVTFGFSPLQEIIFSFCRVIWFHSLSYENSFLFF
jgi:hypothetical protein